MARDDVTDDWRMPPDRFLTVKEVADRLRVSRMTIYRMVDAGTLPSVRIVRSIRIKESDLNHYLEGS